MSGVEEASATGPDGVGRRLPPVIVLSTADYGAPVWTNKQHIASRLAEHTDVYYVDSLGLRRPSLRRADLMRVLSKVWRRSTPRADLVRTPPPPRLEVISPIVIPFHGSRLVRWVNGQLLRRQIAKHLDVGAAILWTFSPVTCGLAESAAKVVYHSVDLLHALPRVPRSALVEEERKLLGAAQVVVASSRGVADHLESLGRGDVLEWNNVADTHLFAGPHQSTAQRANRAVFAGNLTRTKIDFGLIREIAESGLVVALAGPVGIDGQDDGAELEALFRLPNVIYLGNLPQARLAEELRASVVGLIPYRLNEYTVGVFPMKLYEYLSAGLPVVATALPSLAARTEVGLTVAGSSEFVSATLEAARKFNESGSEERKRAAEPHSWVSRMNQVVDVLESLSHDRGTAL